MFLKRKTYQIRPERLAEFTDFFNTYLYPIQVNHGARLVGRWVSEAEDEVMILWEYRDREHYEEVDREYRSSTLRRDAMKQRARLGTALYIKSSESFMTSTGAYTPPRSVVAVSAYITNEQGEVLLVRNMHRYDTLEIPGGQVEDHESIVDAIHREVLEETGATIHLDGIVGVYQNVSTKVLTLTFKGHYVSGELKARPGETHEVGFYPLTDDNIDELIKNEQFKLRIRDARQATHLLPHAVYSVRPFELLSRLEV